jgi:hypothetical protein
MLTKFKNLIDEHIIEILTKRTLHAKNVTNRPVIEESVIVALSYDFN